MVKEVVANLIKAEGGNSVSFKKTVAAMQAKDASVTEEMANEMIVKAIEAGEVARWRGRGGSLRNAGERPEIAAWGSKSGRVPKCRQPKPEAVDNTDGAL